MHTCMYAYVCVPLFIVLCMFIQHTTVRIRNIFSQCCAAQKALDSKKEREAGHGGCRYAEMSLIENEFGFWKNCSQLPSSLPFAPFLPLALELRLVVVAAFFRLLIRNVLCFICM